MVPVVTSMTQSYLTFIKTLVPEYRSSGEFSEFIGDLALGIETLLQDMRNQTLACTHFSPFDFWYVYPKSPHSLIATPWLGGYHVGAMDLCARSVPVPPVPWDFQWLMDQSGAKVDWGALHFNWTPPVKLGEKEDYGEGGIRWRVLNPDECAAAANAQAQQDYASILYASGYLHLAQLAGLLRHVYAAPSASETVVGEVATYYAQEPGTSVTLTSESVFPFPAITTTAERHPQSNRARIHVITQPPGRDRQFAYKVWLRTVAAYRDGTSDYGSVYSTRYENEPKPRKPGTPAFSRLVCEYTGGAIGEWLLFQGATHEQPYPPTSGTVTLQADTFDWWVPVPDSASAYPKLEDYLAELRALGWTPRHEQQLSDGDGAAAASGTSNVRPQTPLSTVAEALAGTAAPGLNRQSTPQPVGYRREVERHPIEIDYTATWNGIDLVVTLERGLDNPNADHRNVDVYLVVEETIAQGQVLHTALPVPLTGQITYVPLSFFNEEAKATAAANAFWRDLIHRYSETAELSPLDPVAQISPRELYSQDGLERAAASVRKEQPEFLKAFMIERHMG